MTSDNVCGLTHEEKIELVNSFIADNGLSPAELAAFATSQKVAETEEQAGGDPRPVELSPLPKTLDQLTAEFTELQRRFNNLNAAAHDGKF